MLQQRGMSIPDLTETERFLSNVNYYRFRGYLIPISCKTEWVLFQTGSSWTSGKNKPAALINRLRCLV